MSIVHLQFPGCARAHTFPRGIAIWGQPGLGPLAGPGCKAEGSTKPTLCAGCSVGGVEVRYEAMAYRLPEGGVFPGDVSSAQKPLYWCFRVSF